MTVFKNSYFIMRHGESEANVQGIIVSDPANGCEDFGLSSLGRQQVIESAKAFKDKAITKIFCSDFLRTQQTAELMAESLGLDAPQQEVGLRERFFGSWEGQSAEHYQEIWQQDELLKQATHDDVEQTEAVLQRGIKVLKQLEQHYQNEVILLVSHGDILQILRTLFDGISSHQHRSLPHHETAEIKLLITAGDEVILQSEHIEKVAI